MIPKHIIEKAIAGGWIPSPLKGQMNYGWKFVDRSSGFYPPCFEIWDDVGTVRDMNWEEIALDPDFWTALGKEMGWGETEVFSWDGKPTLTMYWRFKADRFYDLILRKASQEEIEAFWRSLWHSGLL